MNSPESSNFFSRQPVPAPTPDKPLSIQGRFGRLSYIAWYGFLQLIFVFASAAWTMTLGIVNLSTFSLESDFVNTIAGFGGFGFLVISVLYVYFNIVINARRFHDMNRSGWWMLLFFIPPINFIVLLYLLLGSGTNGQNNYGAKRQNATWEKILAWFIIILILLSFLGASSLISFLMGSGELQTPIEILQNSTEYF